MNEFPLFSGLRIETCRSF